MLTSSTSIANLVAQSAALSNQQVEIARQLSAGTRLTQLSNDPLAAAATVRLSSDVARATGTLSAIQTVQARMQTADSALGAVVQQLTSAVSVAVEAANGTNSTANLAAAAKQLSTIRDSVLGLANSSYSATYLFGGTAASNAPFTQSSGTGVVTYGGDNRAMSLQVLGASLQASGDGGAIFGDGSSSVFATLQNIITTLQSGTTPNADQVIGIRDALQAVIDGRSVLASSASRLEGATTYTSTQKTDLEAAQTNVAASDPVALATALSNTQTQRSALLSSLAAMGRNSLFDYL